MIKVRKSQDWQCAKGGEVFARQNSRENSRHIANRHAEKQRETTQCCGGKRGRKLNRAIVRRTTIAAAHWSLGTPLQHCRNPQCDSGKAEDVDRQCSWSA